MGTLIWTNQQQDKMDIAAHLDDDLTPEALENLTLCATAAEDHGCVRSFAVTYLRLHARAIATRDRRKTVNAMDVLTAARVEGWI